MCILKYLFFLFLCEISFLSLHAQIQVGIGTVVPQKMLHIDGKSNTSGTTNTDDDVVVDKDGNIGIGTISPLAKLDIKHSNPAVKAFTLKTSSSKANTYLTSDADGIGDWKILPVFGSYYVWKITNTHFYISSTALTNFTGTTSVSGNIKGFAANTAASTLKIPAGRYVINIYGDVDGWEYMQVQVWGVSATTPLGYELTSINYRSYLNSTADMWNIEEDTTIYFRLKGFDARNVFWTAGQTAMINNYFSMYYQLSFIRM